MSHLLFERFTSKEIAYLIDFNIGAVWNVIVKWMDEDMKEEPEVLKEIFFKYLNNLSIFI
ncbi:MAG: TetR family transcriptional regulator C-terminal domain-containing protein [Clostridia bacterium]|nr:TetR family transcriptional regulator C-terminal domain-containing protein [Clostridia bacterium]